MTAYCCLICEPRRDLKLASHKSGAVKSSAALIGQNTWANYICLPSTTQAWYRPLLSWASAPSYFYFSGISFQASKRWCAWSVTLDIALGMCYVNKNATSKHGSSASVTAAGFQITNSIFRHDTSLTDTTWSCPFPNNFFQISSHYSRT